MLPATLEGWSGKDYNRRAFDGKMLQKMYDSGEIHLLMQKEGFRQVPYEG